MTDGWFEENGPVDGQGGRAIQRADEASPAMGSCLAGAAVIASLMDAVWKFAEGVLKTEGAYDETSERYGVATRFADNAEDAFQTATRLRQEITYTINALAELMELPS